MKLCFLNAEPVAADIRELMGELKFSVADELTADAVVKVHYVDSDMLSLTLNGKRAAIVFGGKKERFVRGARQLVEWLERGETQKILTE